MPENSRARPAGRLHYCLEGKARGKGNYGTKSETTFAGYLRLPDMALAAFLVPRNRCRWCCHGNACGSVRTGRMTLRVPMEKAVAWPAHTEFAQADGSGHYYPAGQHVRRTCGLAVRRNMKQNQIW